MIDAPVVWMERAEETIPNVLQTWAQARGLRLVAPRDGGSRTIDVDASIAQRVEENLHAARELVTQHDADGAERALARGEALLRAHPELPQGAWLMAEIERGWASRFERLDPRDAERATRHWRAAAALDGGRAAGVGETSAAIEAPIPFALDVIGAGASTELRWDGEVAQPGTRAAPPGLHQLVAKENGAVVFAEWIAVARDAHVRVALPMPEPCSRADLVLASRTCATWVSVHHAAQPATFVVEVCSRASCGPELTVAPIAWVPTKPDTHRGLPRWAGWTLAGISGAAVLGVAAGLIAYFALPPVLKNRWVSSPPE